jgi:hypothetical protein
MIEETRGMIPTWDLESIHWTIPIAIGFFDGYIYREFIKEREDDDVVWRFLCFLDEKFQGIKLYAHYASRFDNKFILASLCQHGEVVKLEAGYMRLRWVRPNIVFEDSFSIIPMSLERMNKMFGVEEKGKWEHEKTKTPWEMGDELPIFKAYLKTDCISLSHSLYKLCEMLGMTFGQMPSISLATTSAKVFDKCFYPVEKIEPSEEFEEFIRKAIYGGRNEVYRRYGENINMYDIHWMYTSCYDTPVPIGKMRWIKPNIDKGTIGEATVKVPKDWYIGPLPKKVRKLLSFPVGEFTDWWDIRELKNAAEMGVDLTIKRQLYCEEEPVLKPFGEFISNLRKEGKTEFWKIFGLSLSGKFGQGRWRDSIQHISEIKNLEGYIPIDSREDYFSTKIYIGRRAPYIRPLISMRIRAEARIRHLKLILTAMKLGDIFYGDTDSLYTTALLPTGENVGDLVQIGKADRGYFIRQKLYATIQKGRLKQRSAGYSDLKLSEEDFKRLLVNESIDIESSYIASYRRTLSTREVQLLERGRQIKGDAGDSRIPMGNDSRPICLPL